MVDSADELFTYKNLLLFTAHAYTLLCSSMLSCTVFELAVSRAYLFIVRKGHACIATFILFGEVRGGDQGLLSSTFTEVK